MKKILIFGAALALVMGMASCDDNHNSDGPQIIHNAVKDIDGNKYDAVRIGDQVWMASNLKTTHYADGTAIPQGNTDSETIAYRYCPNNNPQTVDKYGYLYNWPAVMHGASSSNSNPSGVQGICPTGWHVPSDAEWTELENAVASRVQYGESVAQALASNDTSWENSFELGTPGQNPNLNNSTGFSAVPAGNYSSNGCNNFGGSANFWSATQGNSYFAYGRNLYYYYANVYSSYRNKNVGYSVRCLRD